MNKQIDIIGYSGHSYVFIDAANLSGYVIKSYFDLNKKEQNPFNLKYLGVESDIKSRNLLFVTIADNSTRKNIISNIIQKDKLQFTIIHPSSIISKFSSIGFQTFVNSGVIINAKAKIGYGCIINSGSIVEHESEIGDYCHIAPGSVILGSVTIKEGSFIGANSVIKQGVSIGRNVIVGAGSVILTDIPDNSIVVGNPGSIIKKNI